MVADGAQVFCAFPVAPSFSFLGRARALSFSLIGVKEYACKWVLKLNNESTGKGEGIAEKVLIMIDLYDRGAEMSCNGKLTYANATSNGIRIEYHVKRPRYSRFFRI